MEIPLPRMHADKPAFCDENRVFTFGELLKAAQGLGTHLAGTVDTLHKPVAVLIGRTAESVAAMQGVLYAGGCYVPIDDHMPEARIRRIFGRWHCRLLSARRAAKLRKSPRGSEAVRFLISPILPFYHFGNLVKWY